MIIRQLTTTEGAKTVIMFDSIGERDGEAYRLKKLGYKTQIPQTYKNQEGRIIISLRYFNTKGK